MQDLLKPDFGVLALTILNFALLVFLLAKFAWKPLIGALERREEQVRSDQETARSLRQSAEDTKRELDERLAYISQEAAQTLAQAVKMGQTQQAQLLAQAKEQAERLIAQAKEEIEAEKKQAIAQVQNEIASISLLAAQRVVGEELNTASAQRIVEEVIKELPKK